MKYSCIIERASIFTSAKKPCEEAKKFKFYHKELDNSITEKEVWVVEVNKLDDLMKLCEKYGRIIIDLHPIFYYEEIKAFPKLTIYDDYIE